MKTKQKVLISTPSLDGKLDCRYVVSLIQSFDLLRNQGINYDYHLDVGCSLIADSRNRLTAYFLESNATDLVFIDSDIAWKSQDLLRLLTWNQPLVGGAYQLKSEELSFGVKFSSEIISRNGLLITNRLATGFLRIRRDALDSMINNAGEIGLRQYLYDQGKKKLYAFFDTLIVDNKYVGEDYFFSDLWKKNGGEVLLDPELKLQHIGTRVYEESILDYLKRNT